MKIDLAYNNDFYITGVKHLVDRGHDCAVVINSADYGHTCIKFCTR